MHCVGVQRDNNFKQLTSSLPSHGICLKLDDVVPLPSLTRRLDLQPLFPVHGLRLLPRDLYTSDDTSSVDEVG